MKRRSVHKQTQEPRYKSATWGTRGKTSQNRDTHEKVKTRALENQGCGTHNPNGGVKPPVQSAGHNKKPANGTGRPRARATSVTQPLAGGECSRGGDQAAASTRDERIKNTLSPGGPRMPNEPSGQVAAPTQGTARVRFEFAGRAHRREFTPKLEIKRKENKVKEKEEKFEKKEKRIHHRRAPRGARKWSTAPWWCERGRRGFAEFEVTECVALADGIARRPLEKQRQTQGKTRTKTKGAAPANPREGKMKRKASTRKGRATREGWHTEEKRGRFVWLQKAAARRRIPDYFFLGKSMSPGATPRRRQSSR